VDPFDVYWSARRRGLHPALLESLGPRTHFSRRTILGVRPTRMLGGAR
jgi:hypothetical protein